MGKDQQDELASINGVEPDVFMEDGEEKEVKSQSSKTVYKVKRTVDHYYCTCPAWRNQGGVPVNARSCKHTQELLGKAYEAARLQLKNPDAPLPKALTAFGGGPASSDGHKKKGKPASSKGSEVAKGKGKASAPKSSTSTASKAKKVEEDDEAEETNVKEQEAAKDEDQEMADPEPAASGPGQDGEDELAVIDGIKPNVYMKDGAEREVKSMTSSSMYKIKRTWDHYYCTCPAWRNQGGVPVNARSCKHLQSLLGLAYEAARVKLKNPDGPQLGQKGKPAASKRKKPADEEDDEEDDDGGSPRKKAKTSSGTGKKKDVSVLLANKWELDGGPDPTGWWMSEKLDGVRTFYDGEGMYSRLGNPFTPPDCFLEKLPKDITLDGELFSGRGTFQSTVSVVKTLNSPHWKGIVFHIFDIPSMGSKPFEERYTHLQYLFGDNGKHKNERVKVVEHELVRDREHVFEKLKEVETEGGEGLMLRQPGSPYEPHRSSTLLKIKTFYDGEAEVTGYVPGKGKYKGSTGALKCKMASGKTFSVGSGLSDAQREKPPEVGTIITYRFQELTRDGVPRFPTFVGEAVDKNKPKDALVPDHRKTNAKSS